MNPTEHGPLWPITEQRPRCLLRLPPWVQLPVGVAPEDIRVERRGDVLVLVVAR